MHVAIQSRTFGNEDPIIMMPITLHCSTLCSTPARRILGGARAIRRALAVESTALTTLRHLLAHLAVAVGLTVVEPAWPLAHALVHVVIARRAATIRRWGDGSSRRIGSVDGSNSVLAFVVGACSSISIFSKLYAICVILLPLVLIASAKVTMMLIERRILLIDQVDDSGWMFVGVQVKVCC